MVRRDTLVRKLSQELIQKPSENLVKKPNNESSKNSVRKPSKGSSKNTLEVGRDTEQESMPEFEKGFKQDPSKEKKKRKELIMSNG